VPFVRDETFGHLIFTDEAIQYRTGANLKARDLRKIGDLDLRLGEITAIEESAGIGMTIRGNKGWPNSRIRIVTVDGQKYEFFMVIQMDQWQSALESLLHDHPSLQGRLKWKRAKIG
jgi:hypothetical protein